MQSVSTAENDFVSLAEAKRLTGFSYSHLWTLASAGILGGERRGPAQRWHVRRSMLADLSPARLPARRSSSERPWLRLVVDNNRPATP